MAKDTVGPNGGRVVLLPWVTLKKPVLVGPFKFQPVSISELEHFIEADVVEAVRRSAKTHVDLFGQPISDCTIVLRPRAANRRWNIPMRLWPAIFEATEVVALATLSNQEFFRGHFAPHLNSTLFRAVSFAIRPDADVAALTFSRRGGSLTIGGVKLSRILFQRPVQVEGASAGETDTKLISAIRAARGSEFGARLRSALSPFLLGHSEAPELDDEHFALLSVLAFERLLGSPGKARAFAEAFDKIWSDYRTLPISQARRVRSDNKYQQEQSSWAIHRKWAKELYELRNATMHAARVDPEFSQNWEVWQHIVIAAFAFPLTVKLLLARDAKYVLTDSDIGALQAFNDMLDADMKGDDLNPPAWSSILDQERASIAIRRSITLARETVERGSG